VNKNKNDDSYSAFADFICCFQPSYSYDFACSWRKSGNSSQYKRLIYPKWELQPINSYAWRAAPRSSSAPASPGHARALGDGFSVEVDGGSNRGAYQGGEAGLADGDAARALLKARRDARRLTVRKNPAEIGRSKCRNLPPSSSNCGDDCRVRDAKRWEVCADRVGDVAWRKVGVELVRHGRKLSGRCRGRCSPSCRTSARACESRRR
jgi:hypothetical protein